VSDVRSGGWPTWVWVLLMLQIAILLVALVPWVAMSAMMAGGMMRMPIMPMPSMMPMGQ